MPLGLALTCPTTGRADFIWVNNWDVFLTDATGGPTTVQHSFGSVTANPGVASAFLSAVSDPNVANSGGFVTGTFERKFKLFNNPSDSIVTLFGSLSGVLDTFSGAQGITALSSINATAEILNDQGNNVTTLSWADFSIAINDTDTTTMLLPQATSLILPDDDWSIKGTFQLTLKVNAAPVALAGGSGDINFAVGLTATPIPEPSAFLQLSVGVVAIAGWFRWRRARPARLTCSG